MSLTNHPNFHGVLFTTDVIFAFYEAAKRAQDQKGVKVVMNEAIQKKILDFCIDIEDWVDAYVTREIEAKKNKKKGKGKKK